MSDSLITSYRAAHAALVAERAAILARMEAIDAALLLVPGPVVRRLGRPRRDASIEPPHVPAPVSPPPAASSGTSARSASVPPMPALPTVDPGSVNLREAILLALAHGPANRADLLRRLHQIGYRFSKANPVESLDAHLASPRSGVVQRGRRFALA